MAIADVEKNKRGRGRPKTFSAPITVRLPPGDLAMLDEWIASQRKNAPSRPEAIRRILRWALKGLES